MYQRFTDRARKVMQLANQEAQRYNHEFIGTEHVLLGLIKEGSGVAANVLKNLDVDLRKIRLEAEKLIETGPDMVTMGKLPQTPRAKMLIEYSMEEARNLNHDYVGTEHLLLGLIREEEGVAAQVLINLGLKLQEVREEVLNILGHGGEAAAVAEGRISGSPGRSPREAAESIIKTARAGQRARNETILFEATPTVLFLAWAIFGLGILGLAAGTNQNQALLLPGAVLVGSGVIALALVRH